MRSWLRALRRRAGYRAGEYHLLPHRLQITTGKFAEHWIVSTLLLAGLCYLLWRETGLAGFVNHLRAASAAAP